MSTKRTGSLVHVRCFRSDKFFPGALQRQNNQRPHAGLGFGWGAAVELLPRDVSSASDVFLHGVDQSLDGGNLAVALLFSVSFSRKELASYRFVPFEHRCRGVECRLTDRQLSLFPPLDARCPKFAFAATCSHLFARD